MPLTKGKIFSASLLLLFSASLIFSSPANAVSSSIVLTTIEDPFETARNLTDRLPVLDILNSDDSELFESGELQGSFSLFNREDLSAQNIFIFLKEAFILAANLFLVVINVTGQVLGVLLEMLTK